MPLDKFIRCETVLDPSQCRVMRTGHRVIVKDINKEPVCECLRYDMDEGGYACPPLFTGGAAVGTVLMVKKEKGYWDNEETSKLLSTYIGLASSALEKAEKIRQYAESASFDTIAPGKSLGITMSIGVASFPENGTEYDTLVDAADSALYKAKRNGRNRVEMA